MIAEQRRKANLQREDIASLLSLLVFALLLVSPVLVHPSWWLWKPGSPHSDLGVTHWPNAHFTRHKLWEERRFPLWRPTIMSGTPFAANPLAGLFYPLNWPLLFLPWLPLELAFNASALLHLWLAGATMYAFLRRGLDAGRWAALLAATAYEGSPKLLAHLGAGHVGWVQAWAWLPLVVLCLFKASPSTSRHPWRWSVGAAIALSVQFCADVRMAAYTLLAGAAVILTRIPAQIVERVRNKEVGGHFARFLAQELKFVLTFLALFIGLSACQWLPTLDLLPETTRAAMTFHDAAVWSLPWQYLTGLLLADHGGFQEWMTYLGVSTLAFAFTGLRSLWRAADRDTRVHASPGQRWLGLWLMGLAVFAAWFSLGENGGLFHILWHVVPGLGLLRVPPRAWVLVVFAAAALAGLGLEHRTPRVETIRGMRRWKRAALLVTAALPPMLVVGYWGTVAPPPPNLVAFGVVAPLAVGLCSIPFPGRKAWIGAIAVLLVSLDLLVADATLIEARSPQRVFDDGHNVAEWLEDQPGHFRVYSPSYSISQHLAERHGLELADGVDPVQLRVYAHYLTRAAGLQSVQGYSVTLPPFPEGSDVSTALKGVCPDASMLGQLGVRYAVAAFPLDCELAETSWQPILEYDDTYVYRNESARPVPDTESEMGITLADGTELFRYDPWPVYAGGGISGATLLIIAASGVIRSRRQEQGD